MSSTDNMPNFLKNLAVPRPSSGHLAALGEADRPIAVFSDFDGTIFLQDTGHVLFDKFGCGAEKREEIDASIGKTQSFREASEQLWGSLNVTLPRAKDELKKTLTIDPDFISFFDYLQENDVTFTVISAGMKPLLKTALDTFVGPERSKKIEVISNNGEISDAGKWTPHWLHDSPLGIDKSLAIKEWLSTVDTSKRPPPKIVFVGDGVSDLAAAKQADILFARSGLALEKYCIEHMIPYIPYMRFNDVLHDIKLLMKGNKYHDKEAALAARQARIQQLTGGLGPLSKPASFGIGGDDDDDDDDEDENSDEPQSDIKTVSPVPSIKRPQTPPYEPEFLTRPPLNRNQFSTGA